MRRLSAQQRLQVLLVPWVFVAVYAAIYVALVVPRALNGHILGMCIGAVIGAVWVIFAVAAVTFSRDVLAGRWPDADVDFP
jgi:hypothetical protein